MKTLYISGSILASVLFLTLAPPIRAQEVRVTAGTLLKYDGLSNEAQELQETKEYLDTLESQIAAGLIDSSEIEYVDKGNLRSIFSELNLSDGMDTSSGALSGLVGRLDFLVVITASNSTLARLRLIDVQSGAVKSLVPCPKPSRFSILLSSGPLPCISSFVDNAVTIAKARRAAKQDRLQKLAAAREENRRQQAEQQQENERKQAEAERVAADNERLAEERRAENQRLAEEQRVRSAQEQSRLASAIREITPRYDDLMSQVSAQVSFWENMKSQLRAAGHSLRPEVQSLLTATQTKSNRCSTQFSGQQPEQLSTCLDQLEKQLAALEQYK